MYHSPKKPCSDALHFLLYSCLRLLYLLQRGLSALSAPFHSFLSSTDRTPLPHHVALSCPHLNHPSSHPLQPSSSTRFDAVVAFAHRLLVSGVRHVTIFDPSHPIPFDSFVSQLRTHSHHPDLCLTPLPVTHIHRNHTKHTDFLFSLPAQTSDDKPSQTRQAPGELSAHKPLCKASHHLTLVDPHTGRSSIVCAARSLARLHPSPNLDVSSVSAVHDWLDADLSSNCLPSEPDVLLVFPPPGCSPVPVLNDFPLWQLRLTQIIFASTAPHQLSFPDLRIMLTSAASAPKRFGR